MEIVAVRENRRRYCRRCEWVGTPTKLVETDLSKCPTCKEPLLRLYHEVKHGG